MPIQMCPIEIPDNYEFVRYAKLTARCGETYVNSSGAIDIWNAPFGSSCTYIIVRRVPPVPKYIPFTASTFRPHRDRWVKNTGGSGREARVNALTNDTVATDGTWFTFSQALDTLEFINADGTTEPFGQKVEG